MTDDTEYMQMALKQAELAAQAGEVPVGAVLVLENGQVFSSNNAPISRHDASAHAEMRVIRAACAATQNYRLVGSSLYVTLEPCTMCAGCIIHARIGRLVYAASDPKTGAVKSLYQLLSDKRLNHQPQVTASIMADESSRLLKQFFKHCR
ncbi:MAG: tRNA adenosine(34) deaminase TadA [Mariprofundus sp.]|nr:tRNA adenosine(34) deaminase TadA [Mariprofundus sp.]